MRIVSRDGVDIMQASVLTQDGTREALHVIQPLPSNTRLTLMSNPTGGRSSAYVTASQLMLYLDLGDPETLTFAAAVTMTLRPPEIHALDDATKAALSAAGPHVAELLATADLM